VDEATHRYCGTVTGTAARTPAPKMAVSDCGALFSTQPVATKVPATTVAKLLKAPGPQEDRASVAGVAPETTV
jgi:hypothetical protein